MGADSNRGRGSNTPAGELPRHIPLGSGGEFDAIRTLLDRWGKNAHRIGDDGALLDARESPNVVVSIDTSVENVHFRREWLNPEEIGYRAAAAALSDLAAMGATPLGMLVALTIPDSWRGALDAIGDGIGEAASSCNAPILGGDLSRGTELSLTFSVIGTAQHPLSRSLARPGDLVYMTGSVGGSLLALRDLQAGRQPDPAARRRFAHPVPRLAEAAWLARAGASAAVDVSDGLVADLGHLAAASGVAIRVHIERLSVVHGISAIDACRSGEEYELVVTTPRELDTREFQRVFGLDLTCIGTVTEGDAIVRTFLDGGEVEPPTGYLHFTPES